MCPVFLFLSSYVYVFMLLLFWRGGSFDAYFVGGRELCFVGYFVVIAIWDGFEVDFPSAL